MPMARKRRARIETRLESPAEAIRRPGGQKCLPRQMSLHGELILWLAWSYQDLGRKEGLSPRGKTRHDVRAYLMTYLKEFYMKLKIRQQAGLRSFEHSSRLGGRSRGEAGGETDFRWANGCGSAGALANPIAAAPSDPKTRQHRAAAARKNFHGRIFGSRRAGIFIMRACRLQLRD